MVSGRQLDEITGEIVDAAVKLHSGLGPGLLESIYEIVLLRDLQRRGLKLNDNGQSLSNTMGWSSMMRFAPIYWSSHRL